MVSSPFRTGMALRIAALFLTVVTAAWMIEHTQWYAAIALCVAAVVGQTVLIMQFAMRSSHETARFLDAIAVDDTSQSFSGLSHDSAHS